MFKVRIENALWLARRKSNFIKMRLATLCRSENTKGLIAMSLMFLMLLLGEPLILNLFAWMGW